MQLLKYLIAVIILSFPAIAFSQGVTGPYVTMLQPSNATILQRGSVYLGKVGPGQTFYITISSTTQNSSGYMYQLGWNQLSASSLPRGWLVQNSPLNIETPSIKITVSPTAPNGTYGFNVTALNIGNYSGLGNVEFAAYVNVTPNVFKLNVTQTNITSAPGVPYNIYVNINNTGVSDAPFNITLHGLPAWNSSKTVIALHHTQDSFVYPIYVDEPGVYHISLYVSSTSSPLIYKQTKIKFTTKATLAGDYAALGQGALAFPIVYAPAYAVMYLISLLASYAK